LQEVRKKKGVLVLDRNEGGGRKKILINDILGCWLLLG